MYPTKYDKKYCDQLIEFMGQGKSFKAFAGHINVERQTLYNWCADYPEFKQAKGIAFSKRVYSLEEKLWEIIRADKPHPNLTAFLALLNNTIWKRDKKLKGEASGASLDDTRALTEEVKRLSGLLK